MVAGVSLCGLQDIVLEQYDECLHAIQSTAAAISREMGYQA